MRALLLIALLGAPRRLPAADWYTPPTPAACHTRCGMSAPGNCAALQRLEDSAVRIFGRRVLDWDEDSVCAALDGWTVEVHDYTLLDRFFCKSGQSWVLVLAGACVTGYTWRYSKTIEVFNFDWEVNALAHEMVHAVDVQTVGRAGHCRWMQRGIKPALLEITGLEDTSDSDCSDSKEIDDPPRPRRHSGQQGHESKRRSRNR